MSSSSPQEAAATEQARTQAGLAGQLQGVAYPELQSVLGLIRRELGAGGEPSLTRGVFTDAESSLNASYDAAKQGQAALIQQQNLQSGGQLSSYQTGGALTEVARNLDQDRVQALRNLRFQRATAGLSEYNTLMTALGQGSQLGLQLGAGAAGNAGAGIAGMSQMSPLGGALGGAASGAAAGSMVNVPWGTVVGGVAGGIGGYFSSGG